MLLTEPTNCKSFDSQVLKLRKLELWYNINFKKLSPKLES